MPVDVRCYIADLERFIAAEDRRPGMVQACRDLRFEIACILAPTTGYGHAHDGLGLVPAYRRRSAHH
jgi:hypothetical protein